MISYAYEDSWQAKAIYFIKRYVFLIISIIAWINNGLAIAVLQTKTYRGTSTGFLLTALACADMGYISTEGTKFWTMYLVGYDIEQRSPMSCKWHSLMIILLWGYRLGLWSL